jgi:hypothetical protein
LDELNRLKEQHFLWRNSSTIEREESLIDEENNELEGVVLPKNRERQGFG